MFVTLIIVTFVVAFIVSFIVVKIFNKSLISILSRLVDDAICDAWIKYLKFAVYVVGISSGVRVWQLEKYLESSGGEDGSQAIVLNSDRWVLEVYHTIIGTLQGIAWLLLIFFIFALIAYAIVRVMELKKQSGSEKK